MQALVSMRSTALTGITSTALVLTMTGCGTGGAPVSTRSADFPTGGAVDYQLGGSYEPPEGVTVVTRDSLEDPAEGVFSICYVNGFQSQPGELEEWSEAGLVLLDGNKPVNDVNWPDEYLLDTRLESNRAAIAEKLAPIIRSCAQKGFDAIEFDNLDSDTRSGGLLDVQGNTDLARRLLAVAHDAGLLAGQKNAAERAIELGPRVGFDFAVAEECAAFNECGDYAMAYGDAVIDIEYTDAIPEGFDAVCEHPDTPALTVLRDRDLTTPDSSDYAYDRC
jgi:hypothetical protein